MINQAIKGLPENVQCDQLDNQKRYDGVIIVSPNRQMNEKIIKPYVQLIPKNVVVGVGCRRGVEKIRILKAIDGALEQVNRNLVAVKLMATVDIKRDEKGLLEAAKQLGVEVKIIEREAIKQIEHKFNGSAFVKKTIGVSCVAEPCGYLASNAGHQLSNRLKDNGVTVSIWEEKFERNPD